MDAGITFDRPHAELHVLREKLQDILQSVPSFAPSVPRPPIIDSSFDLAGDPAENAPRQDAVKGLRALKDSVKRDLGVLDKFLAHPNFPNLPALSTNAPYLISVWNEVQLAPQPVSAIWSTYSESGKTLHPRRRGLPKEAGVKVDVVADGGRRWIRVNSTKNSRLLAEFRELDSYMTDSEEDSDVGDGNGLPSLASAELDNSVLRMGRSLLLAAQENPIPGTNEIPAVTLRLTRLDPSPSNAKDHDPRIAQTIEQLTALGIDVQLGERTEAELTARLHEKAPSLPPLGPTRNVNLDLSILIALVSDLTHALLPASVEDAEARFTPSSEYVEWKKKRIVTLKNTAADQLSDEQAKETETDYIVRPSRALVTQVIQEMGKGLYRDMFERLSAVSQSNLASTSFWTTPEAKERCLQIVAKIGGRREKLRAEVLFAETGLGDAEEEFWRDARYPRGFIPLFPIHIFASDAPDADTLSATHTEGGAPLSPFFHALAATCRTILAQETIPHPRATPPTDAAGDDLGEIQRATVTRANPRLTAHTVQSMLWGAVRGWTTLTANKTSVKAILREMRAARGGALWDGRDEARAGGQAASPAEWEPAAIWMVDPRSLAEGMRADYVANSQS